MMYILAFDLYLNGWGNSIFLSYGSEPNNQMLEDVWHSRFIKCSKTKRYKLQSVMHFFEFWKVHSILIFYIISSRITFM